MSSNRKSRKAGLSAALSATGLAAAVFAACLLPTRGVAQLAGPNSVPRPGPLEHYLDNYTYLARVPEDKKNALDKLHYIPMGSSSYLSLGFGFYPRRDLWRKPSFGLRGVPNDQLNAFSVAVHGDLHLFDNRARVYIELQDSRAYNKKLVTAGDGSGSEVEMAFLDIGLDSEGVKQSYLRFGRQNLRFGIDAFFTQLYPGLNIRKVYDGVRGTYVLQSTHTTINAFAVRPVANKFGSWNDTSQHQADFYGVYVTQPWFGKVFSEDFYALNMKRHQHAIAGFKGDESRYTWGTRFFGHPGGFGYTLDVAYQTGHVGLRDIEAWGVYGKAGYTFSNAWLKPTVGARLFMASGNDNPKQGSIGTFDAMQPANGPMFGYGGFLTWQNMIAFGPEFSTSPAKKLSVDAYVMPVWKQTRSDYIYRSGGFVLPGTNNVPSRFEGTTLITNWQWNVNKYVTLIAQYQYFKAGAAIHEAKGKSGQYVGVNAFLLL